MANDVSANPMVLDTASANALWKSKVKITNIIWSAYSSQASRALLQGVDGKIKWMATGAADLSDIDSHRLGWVNGLVLPLLDDGIVLVYVE